MRAILLICYALLSGVCFAASSQTDLAFALGLYSEYAYEHAQDGFFPSESDLAESLQPVFERLISHGTSKRWASKQDLFTYLQKCFTPNGRSDFDPLAAAFGTGVSDEIEWSYLAGVWRRSPGQLGFHVQERDKAAHVFRLLARRRVSVKVEMALGIPGGTSFEFAGEEPLEGVRFVGDLRKLADQILAGSTSTAKMLRRRSRPNKSLQPTATAVLPPAAQEIMPAVAVAEH
jgi:hypothetical protein